MDMGIFRNLLGSTPATAGGTPGAQERLASIGEMLSAQTQAAYAAAARQLVPGLNLEAAVDPANPAAIWLDLGRLN